MSNGASLRRWRKLGTAGLISCIVLSFLLVEGLIIHTARVAVPAAAEYDYVLILGSGLNNGRELSEKLIGRLELGLTYLKQDRDSKVIVSGGKGRDEDRTEAEVMEDYLVLHGIDRSRIIREDRSTSTFENLLYTKELLGTLNSGTAAKLLLVTSDYHVFRASFLARRLGLTVVAVGAPSAWLALPKGYGREYLAVIKSALLDW